MDWKAWHEGYEREGSPLPARLEMVRARVREALDAAPPGPLRAVSVCAGQGHDLIGVLADHPRAADVTARLVELDPGNVESARGAAAAAGLSGVEVVCADAGLADVYAGLLPAELVLVCGVFGNLTDADVDRLTDFCGALCATGGTLVWTRNRKGADLFARIRDRLEAAGFTRLWTSPGDVRQGVAAHRFDAAPRELPPGTRLFTFVGYDELARRGS